MLMIIINVPLQRGFFPYPRRPADARSRVGGTQTGSYQTGSYQKGRFTPPKPTLLYFCCLIRPRLYASERDRGSGSKNG